MHIFTYIDKDTTIYSRTTNTATAGSERQHQNTGLDSIVELNKYLMDGNYYNSRILLKFDMTALSSDISAGTIPGTATHSLIMYTSQEKDIPLKYDVYAYPISESWEMGTGKTTDSPIVQDGASWKYKDGYLKGSGSQWRSSSFASDTDYVSTGSSNLGGSYYKGKGGAASFYTSKQSFEYETGDLNIDVSPSVAAMHANSFENQGFIIKRSDEDESNSKPLGNLQFFSRDTHTMYLPRLETKWDDSSWSTGSLTALDVDDDIVLYMKGLKPEYRNKAVEKFRVTGRKRIVAKTYSTSSDYLSVKYLPQTTYYSVIDAQTDETLIDFDDYTKVSCDIKGNFFNFRLSTLQPERFYKFAFKVVNGTNVEFFDDGNFQFKVVR